MWRRRRRVEGRGAGPRPRRCRSAPHALEPDDHRAEPPEQLDEALALGRVCDAEHQEALGRSGALARFGPRLPSVRLPSTRPTDSRAPDSRAGARKSGVGRSGARRLGGSEARESVARESGARARKSVARGAGLPPHCTGTPASGGAIVSGMTHDERSKSMNSSAFSCGERSRLAHPPGGGELSLVDGSPATCRSLKTARPQ